MHFSDGIAAFAILYGPLKAMYVFSTDVNFASYDNNSLPRLIWLGWLWIFSVIAAFAACRWKSLWLLAWAPFALYFPVLFIFFLDACDIFGRCFPAFDAGNP